MKCPKCRFENREGAKFCGECGTKFEITCPECGANNRAENKFCDECGHSLKESQESPAVDYSKPQSYTPKFLADKILTNRSALEGERKLVTVLFADVANYTAMSEALDPEEVHQIMDGCFNILMDEIHRFEGTINQFTGDGVMALFGAPLAHEDHAQRACHAALSILKILENYGAKVKHDYGLDFKMRIGLNSGTVVVASIGDDLRMDYTAVGDTTNLAARMESKAEPGKVLVSGATHKLVKNFFEFYPLGKIEVKGKEQPQEAYELIKGGEIETRISASVAKGLTKFVGRKNSMATIKESYEQALSGSGQVVGIVGEAGVGKSRLLFEFASQLPQGEIKYLEGRCLHFGIGMVYLPILDMLRSYFEIKEGDPESVIKEKLLKKIRQLDERLSDTLPSFQELLSVKVDDEKYIQLDPGHKKMRTFEAIRNLFIRVSERQPLVLAVEDLHWIDKTSEECISYLIDWLANTRIMLILLYRLEYTHHWGSKSYYTKIGLTQLGTVSSRLLVQAILEDDKVPLEIRELVLNRAGGNPLFVEELTQSLMENGTIVRKNNEYMLTRDVSEIQVPDTIQGIIAARIDRIEESMKHVIQMASVIGREFAFRILQTIIEMKKDLKSHLLNLQGLEFISQKRLFPELEYIFKHALTQKVAYNSLLQKRRKDIHEKIGKTIESLYPDRLEEYYELLAYHFGRSENKDKTLEYLNLANQKTIKLNAVNDAMAYFKEGMQLLDNVSNSVENRERRISMLVNQWIVFFLLFQVPAYREFLAKFEPMAFQLDNSNLAGSFYSRLGWGEWVVGDLDQSVMTLSKAIKLLKKNENYEEIGFVYMTLIWSHLFKGDFDHAIRVHKKACQAKERHFNLRNWIWSLAGASWAYTCSGRWYDAIEYGNKALRLAKEYSNKSLISFSAWILSIAYSSKGDFKEGVKYGELAIEKAPTPGDKVWAQTWHGFALSRSGESAQVIDVFTSLIPMYRATGFIPGEVLTLIILGEAYWNAGNSKEAKNTLSSGLKLAERTGMRFGLGWGNRLMGEIALKTDPSKATLYFEKSVTIAKRIKAENELALTYVGYGRYYRQKGNVVQAKEYLSKALNIFERSDTLIEPENVRKELSELPKC